MTRAFPSEAESIPVTFLGKCQGLDRSTRLAGGAAQEAGRGALCIPSSCQGMPLNARTKDLRSIAAIRNPRPPEQESPDGSLRIEAAGQSLTT
ncbi:hypothetical protein CRENBAI_020569, partial [Crenichthys baileyi]